MIDGLNRAVVKDVLRNSATKRVVVDTRGLTEAQHSALKQNIGNALGNSPKKAGFSD
jgi:hypothetical protein